MAKQFYNITNLSMQERKELFEKDSKNYVYSVLHDIIDQAYKLTEEYEQASSIPFYEMLPFEALTQLLNFMVGVYDTEIIFDRIHLIEQEFKSAKLLGSV